MSVINESVTTISNWTGAQFSANKSPATKFILVQGTDIDGVNYVTGSEGKQKVIYEYADYDETQLITETNLFYGDANFPKTPTKIKVKAY